MSAIVFGSLNMDLASRVPRIPTPGETILGSEFVTTAGGKGANQAVALAKLGVATQMIGRVGGDDFGRTLIAGLQSVPIQTDNIFIDPSTHSGVALITVAETGENQIIGIFGANGCVDATDIARLQPALADAQYLLLQLEIPIAAVQLAAQAGKAAGVTVILDPAPVQTPDLTALYPHIDFLLPNEVEASQLVGFDVHDLETAKTAATQLQRQGAPTVIIKLGAKGAFYQTPSASGFVPAFTVAAVDTVACGDAFAGGLTAGLLAGLPLANAIQWGNAAGALAATQAGAQVAMPDKASLEQFLHQHCN
ncbi:ribokinase [filamentous cyanobacterium LEGE 11480]|uniref:Ribokinase n=1 Tax=Romeriopsis navalis LEGE 11480 TaxID=2777977 RepID=A0A928VHG5_9CYAN|nr:ribokinase [Romeriopsis navalis]MBE9028410.1 ribokinase [Romeriopsis navalis LEGE 11480]